jgi:hypothetical protein
MVKFYAFQLFERKLKLTPTGVETQIGEPDGDDMAMPER